MGVHERLDELYAIGDGVGANRVGGSTGEQEAHELAAGWMEDAGFRVETDGIGNLIGRLGDGEIWTGSHLDSVPYGGKFDGALGVVAGIEAVQRVGVHERLDELYAIGDGVGANRVGGSTGEQEAHELAAGWMEDAGFRVETDGIGNLIGRLGDGEIWTGSHLDSVPYGGKFDGALGVVAGIEAVQRVGAGTVVVFRDEERGCIGSSAFIQRDELPACFLEVHVEQGPILERADAPLGLAMGIVGIVRAERIFEGRAGHAGTVPMEGRADALVSAAEYILRVRDAAVAVEGAVATVGQIDVEPGAVNVIPRRVRISVDARAPDRARLDRLVDELELINPDFRLEPVPMAREPLAALRAELQARRLPVVELPSGAGHDAAVLAGAGVPTAMLFVRSLNGGISHSPQEESAPEDVELAVDVLAGAIRRLISGGV